MAKGSVFYGALVMTLLVPTVFGSAIRANAATKQAIAVTSTQQWALSNPQNESKRLIATQVPKIDQISKRTSSAVGTKAAWNSHYTYRNFWWGARYYFTSNVAVAQMQYELSNDILALGIIGVIGNLFSAGAASIISIGGAIYLNQMSNDLGYSNVLHVHNQIYMDVNVAGGYSMHILA